MKDWCVVLRRLRDTKSRGVIHKSGLSKPMAQSEARRLNDKLPDHYAFAMRREEF